MNERYEDGAVLHIVFQNGKVEAMYMDTLEAAREVAEAITNAQNKLVGGDPMVPAPPIRVHFADGEAMIQPAWVAFVRIVRPADSLYLYTIETAYHALVSEAQQAGKNTAGFAR